MIKKLAIIGKGTAGAQAAAHFVRWMPGTKIEWHFDPSIPTKAVGEGTNLVLPRTMAENFAFGHRDLGAVEGSFKIGIYKEGWGKQGKPFFHDFPAPSVGYHFNAKKLQEYILKMLEGKVSFVEKNTKAEEVDADYVVDCSGKPESLEGYNEAECIPLNAVKVFHCDWDFVKFNWTLTIARPHGWVFGIPLQTRCSIGYMYNNTLTTEEEIDEDVQAILNAYELQCSRTVGFPFKSYTKTVNFTDRIAYNGDKSFFLEPLEATSTGSMDQVNRLAFDIMHKNMSTDDAHYKYDKMLDEIYNMIMLHYYAGSPFQSKFWDFAQGCAAKKMEQAKGDTHFKATIKRVLATKSYMDAKNGPEYGTWWDGSFYQNIHGLGIADKLKMHFKV